MTENCYPRYGDLLAKKVLYVNGKFLSQTITGVQRYAWGVLTAWDEALSRGIIDPAKYAIRILAPSNARPFQAFRNIEIEVAPWQKGKVWEQLYLPLRSRGELLFSPFASAPVFKRRHVVTIHDAGVSATPEQYSRAFRLYYRFVYWSLGKNALNVFTVSEFSKRELYRYFAIPGISTVVARPGYEQILVEDQKYDILAKHKLDCGKYVLAVSSRSPIKNFDTLIKAWRLLGRKDVRLVIVGGYNSQLFGKRKLDDSEDVTYLGYVRDGELRALYENAACFVYPSLYEGFGLPPVEAMACNCPVVVSTCSALPETCGDAALYCLPLDECDICAKIEAVINNHELADHLRKKGLDRVTILSYQNCAATLWDSMVKLL